MFLCMKTKPCRPVQVIKLSRNQHPPTISACIFSAYTTPIDPSSPISYTNPVFLSSFHIIVKIYDNRSQFPVERSEKHFPLNQQERQSLYPLRTRLSRVQLFKGATQL